MRLPDSIALDLVDPNGGDRGYEAYFVSFAGRRANCGLEPPNRLRKETVAGLDHELGAPKPVSGPLNWARSHPPWLLQFRLACRALEVQTAAAARYWLRRPVQQTPVGAQLLPGGEVFAHA